MPLQNLVDYFNDRFGQEHRSSFRPFLLEDGAISALFGQIKIGSVFSPIRQALKPAEIIGHASKLKVSTHEVQYLYSDEIENLLSNHPHQADGFESIINFDRLSRTVHMLNYLPITHLQGVLFLEVDPRHILGVKKDHGAYFEEVIGQCGLETKNVVIIMSVNSHYARHYQELITGLDNYRRRGYQIALKFEYVAQESQSFDLITKLSPNYVSLSARHLEQVRDNALFEKLHDLKALVVSTGGQTILQQIDQKKSESLARTTGFDLVQGSYYERLSASAFLPELAEAAGALY
ncbi:EAL domain-containing protein [Methylobacter sp. Wu8]|uniref:EAL domain-containing protein n=1 Tax=Methylobacter tundripaludum TaxID=173365 RepID=A0A2S6GU32_9GAMM|nr:EAL domain-containing protein [Methylobacter tundripaludum]MCK9634929.1 EAL domain-containing protein [Methylobacter tundripaludum]PPK68699.1 EAL domain-containing protein [Methylobacter tundripaludum]